MKIRLFILGFLLVCPLFSEASVPAFPMAFWGTVTVDNQPAPVGSKVTLYAGNTAIGSVVLEEVGIYGYTESVKQKLVVGESEGVLTFKIQSPAINGGVETGGVSPVTHTKFISGETVRKDLSFVITQTTAGGGGNTSGGGGGGGGKKKVLNATVAVLGISTSTPTTTLSEEERKIELQKQIIQILTQLIALLKQRMLLNSI